MMYEPTLSRHSLVKLKRNICLPQTRDLVSLSESSLPVSIWLGTCLLLCQVLIPTEGIFKLCQWSLWTTSNMLRCLHNYFHLFIWNKLTASGFLKSDFKSISKSIWVQTPIATLICLIRWNMCAKCSYPLIFLSIVLIGLSWSLSYHSTEKQEP